MNIPMLLSPELVEALAADGIKPSDYSPAYGGESVGLDLYNAGPELIIRPAMSLMATRQVVQEVAPGVNIQVPVMLDNWLDVDKQERDTVFKTLVPTGLRLALPPGWGAFVRGRGSVLKTPIDYRAGVIDPGYTDQIFVGVVNLGPVPYTIPAGAKLPFQIVVTECAIVFESKSYEEFSELAVTARRQTSKLGSSDNK